MDAVKIDDLEFRGVALPLQNGTLLVILANRGTLGCGYLNMETAEKLHDALAIVSGVKNYDDMLQAQVRQVSAAAANLGVRPGMTGREALLLMK